MRLTDRYRQPVALAAILGLLIALIAGPRPANAQDDVFAVGFGEIDGEFRIDVQPQGIPVAALELTVSGLPESMGDCAMTEMIGACTSSDGTLRFVGVHPLGLTDDTVVARAQVNGGDISAVEVVVSLGTDVNGAALTWQSAGLSDAAVQAPSAPFEVEGVQVPTSTGQGNATPVAGAVDDSSVASAAAQPNGDAPSGGLSAVALIAIVVAGLVLLAALAAALSRQKPLP